MDQDDRIRWVKDHLKTAFGDSNLDGQFNSSDLVRVFIAGEYEDDIDVDSGWAEGDWDGDGDFTSSDLVFVFREGEYEAASKPDTPTVPEPASGLLDLIARLDLPWSFYVVVRRELSDYCPELFWNSQRVHGSRVTPCTRTDVNTIKKTTSKMSCAPAMP